MTRKKQQLLPPVQTKVLSFLYPCDTRIFEPKIVNGHQMYTETCDYLNEHLQINIQARDLFVRCFFGYMESNTMLISYMGVVTIALVVLPRLIYTTLLEQDNEKEFDMPYF